MKLRALLAALSGVLYFTGFVGFDQWYLSWVCLVPLFFALENVTNKQAFFLGWLMGTVLMAGGFYWVAYTIHHFGYMPWALAGVGSLLLCAAQGLELAVFGFVYVWLNRRTRLSPLILAPAVFVFAEFLSPQLFPHYFANSQYKIIPLIQICDITGVAGLSALLVFVNACVYILLRDLLREKRVQWRPVAAALLVVALVLTYGYFRVSSIQSWMSASPKLRVGVTQPNMGLREKNRDPQKAIRANQELSLALKNEGAELIVWPETAVAEPQLGSDENIPLQILSFPQKLVIPAGVSGNPEKVFAGSPPTPAGMTNYALLTGMLQTENSSLYNVAALAEADGKILGVYKKQKLLAFGEHIPFGKTFPKLYDWFPYISDFSTGKSNAPLVFRNYLLSVNICYEEILPRLIRKMAAFSPHVFINITNDNWFGRTHEPIQHLVLAVFRSIEHRRWLVRSTNTGISAFVDATGKIVARAPLMEKAALIHNVPMMTGKTIYTKFGDWFSWISVAFVVGCAVRVRKN